MSLCFDSLGNDEYFFKKRQCLEVLLKDWILLLLLIQLLLIIIIIINIITYWGVDSPATALYTVISATVFFVLEPSVTFLIVYVLRPKAGTVTSNLS